MGGVWGRHYRGGLPSVVAGIEATRPKGGGGPPPPVPTLAEAILAAVPTGYWKLDDPSSTTAVDSSGNALDGTYSGTYTLAAHAGADGGDYTDFGSGAGGRVTIADADQWSVNTAPGLTIVGLIRPEAAEMAATTPRMWIAKGAAAAFEYASFISQTTAGRLKWDITQTNGTAAQAEYVNGALTPDDWNLVILRTADANAATRPNLYVNSATAATSSDAGGGGTYSNAGAALNIGWRADSPAGLYWHGGLAHVAMFAGALTAGQITAIVTAAANEGWI